MTPEVAVIMQPSERKFAQPQNGGMFADEDCENIYGPGTGTYLQVVEQADGWRAGVNAMLPEAMLPKPPNVRDSALPTKEEAIVAACEALIAFLSQEKHRGGKKHKKQAGELQDWALDLESRATAAIAVPPPEPIDLKMRDAQDITAAVAQSPVEATALGDGIAADVTAAPEGAVVRMVPLSEIYEHPLNPRQIYPEAKMRELVSSMQAEGFRPWCGLVGFPREEGGYWLGAGHRRFRAAGLAGIESVPVFVCPMSEERLLDVLNFDNSGREDVHPLHEAAGWEEWMRRTGKGVNDIARRIGQSKEYVYQRLKYKDLIEPARQAFIDGKIKDGHAILIARRPADVQKKALKYLTPPAWAPTKIPTVRELDGWLHHSHSEDLNRAAFDREDTALLAGAGDCMACPKRAANIPGYEFPENRGDEDPCTDPRCYSQKLTNHLVHIKEQYKKSGEVIEVSESWGTKKKGVLPSDRWERAAKTDKNAKTAVIVDGDKVGRVIQVRVKPAPKQEPRVSPEEQERLRNAQEEKRKTEKAIRKKIMLAICEKVTSLGRADLECLLANVFDRNTVEVLCQFTPYASVATFCSSLPKLKDVELYRLMVAAIAADELSAWRLAEEPKLLLGLAKRYKVDAAGIRRGFDETQKEAESGTRREVVANLPALGAAPAKLKRQTKKKKSLPAAAKDRMALAHQRLAVRRAEGKKGKAKRAK